jgi:glycosyltransferase involved in cell wall biosynthesis
MDVSIITSLYGSANDLGGFLERLEVCLRSVERCGYSAESIIISNAPTKRERRTLDTVCDSVWWSEHSRVIAVERETIYASWNRGLRASTGTAIAFWNADDYRNPAALIEGIKLVRQGHAIVRFPWVCVTERTSRFGMEIRHVVDFQDHEGQARLDPQVDFRLGPFFVFHRRLAEDYGPFDEQFHIAGDWEWQLRVVRHVRLTWGESLAGVSFADGENLSGSGNPRMLVEQNVIFKRYSIDRPLWPLDDRAKGLAASYGADVSTQTAGTHDWAYDRRWLRLRPFRQMYRRCRRIVGTPIRRARARKGESK